MARAPKQPLVTMPDPEKMDPQTMEDFLERGWLYYSLKKFDPAEADFDRVIQQEPANVEGWYGLGLTLKAMGKAQKAIEAFSRVTAEISGIDDRQRATIITRLAHGQINQIRTGNWNLEKEVWRK